MNNFFIRNTKRFLSFLIVLSLFLPVTALAASRLPCTPTEGAQGNNDLFTCINNVYKYALVICSIAAVMMIIFAGYTYIFSGGNEKKAASAKNWISTSLVGLAVLLTGFLLLRQINPNLLTIKSISPESIDQQSWFDPDTGEDNLSGNLPPVGNITVPTGTAQELAKQILAMGSKVALLGDASDPRSSAKQNILDTSNGQPAWTSARSQKGSVQVPLDSKMLAGIIAAADAAGRIQVNHLNGGRHSANSRHYKGKGFDIQVNPSEIQKNKLIMDACRAAGATELLGPPGTGYSAPADHKTHVHCGWS